MCDGESHRWSEALENSSAEQGSCIGWRMDKPSTPKQMDFDAEGNIGLMFEIPGRLRKFKSTPKPMRIAAARSVWAPECANCGERMEAFEEGPQREPKSGLLYSGWFSPHCGSYYFLCES